MLIYAVDTSLLLLSSCSSLKLNSMLMFHIWAISLVASGTMFQVEAAASSVRITTIPSKGPFRIQQMVQFSCEVEPAQSGPVTYQWRSVEYVNGGSSYSSESFNRTFYISNLHYCWYFCSVSLNGTVLGSADKLVEVHGVLQTDEPVTRAFSLQERMVMRINISDYNSLAQYISSLAWHHNGTELTSDDRVIITNNGTSLTISNMAESDAGKYEVRINSTGSSSSFCDRNILPMLENLALYAPVTFLLQESNLPKYNPEDIILDYALPAYQGSAQQSFAIDNTFMINPTALVDDTRYIFDYLYKDGERISDRSTYNNTTSYDNTTTQSLRITYNNTDDIAGHYIHTAVAYYYYDFNTSTCPDYGLPRNFVFFYRIPVFILYWNIRSYERLAIRRGANPVRIYNGCPSEEDNEDILVDVLQLLSSEFQVVPLGLAKSYAATSCMQVADASPQNKAGLYWITDGTHTQQEYCNF